MKGLQIGDTIFHYNSTRRAVLGISLVIQIGQHKGAASDSATQRPGTQYTSYEGHHLSEDYFTPDEVSRYRRYRRCLEVHTIRCMERKLPKLPRSCVPLQACLVPIPNREALNYLSENNISLDQLQPIKV